MEHLREVFDKISDDITNLTEKENFEIYAKTLGTDFHAQLDARVTVDRTVRIRSLNLGRTQT